MLRKFWLLTGWLAMLALAPGLARAVELKSHEVNDDEKVIHFTFKLSAETEPTEEFYFDGNFYSLTVPGLVLTRQQLRASEVSAPKHLRDFYKYIRFVQKEGGAQLRIYLSKLCTPADPQLMGYGEGVIKVDLVKPLFKLEGQAEPSIQAGNPADNGIQSNGRTPEPGFIPDAQPASEPSPAAETEPIPASNTGTPLEAPGGTLRTGNPVSSEDLGQDEPDPEPAPEWPETAPDLKPEQPDTTDTTGAAPEYGSTPAGELLGGATQSAPTKYSRQDPSPSTTGGESEPASTAGEPPAPGSFTSGPSYKQFDLGSVPASNVEIRALPFRQAMMQLVADCGFNVVVDDSVDNTEVNLNFTQKELSLKSALDLLCIAYDLSYVVEDDAIVIKAK